MEQKYKKIYVEWWRIQRSTITGLVIFIVVACTVVFGGWYAIKNSWFVATTESELPKNAAKIISFEGDVRITRAATRETIIVTKETYVAAGDTIQTQADGRAIVQMIDQSVYSVRPNSTVVIRDNSSIFGGGNNVRVSLDDGQLNVRTEQQPENTENVVEMRDSQTEIGSDTDASFNADNRGAEIRVSRGGVETTVGGNKTTIGANEYAAVNPGGVSTKEQLLPPPKPGSPSNMAQVVDTGAGAGVSLNWSDEGATPLSGYYLQVARSSYFASDSIFVDRSSLGTREYRLGNLTPGTYYWRLKASSRSGQTSDWSEPWKFSVVRREANRPIAVTDWKVENVGGNVYIVTGRTQAGVQVKSQGNQVFAAADGTFRLQISTPLSESAVELSDDAGNRAGVVLSLRNAKVLRRY